MKKYNYIVPWWKPYSLIKLKDFTSLNETYRTQFSIRVKSKTK